MWKCSSGDFFYARLSILHHSNLKYLQPEEAGRTSGRRTENSWRRFGGLGWKGCELAAFTCLWSARAVQSVCFAYDTERDIYVKAGRESLGVCHKAWLTNGAWLHDGCHQNQVSCQATLTSMQFLMCHHTCLFSICQEWQEVFFLLLFFCYVVNRVQISL